MSLYHRGADVLNSMHCRISVVDDVNIKALVSSSTFIAGDTGILKPRARIMAVQRVYPFFYGDEGNFEEYPLYSKPIPHLPNKEKVQMTVRNESPIIKVNHIKVLGVSASSIVQIGTNWRIDSEARVKHFRQLYRTD